MSASYAIWREDAPAGVVGFDTAEVALAAVRRAIAEHGATSISRWTLVHVPNRGAWQTGAEGAGLVKLAQRSASGATRGRATVRDARGRFAAGRAKPATVQVSQST